MKKYFAQTVGVSRETALADRNVTLDNLIVNASHSLNLSEKRIISAAIAKIDSLSKSPSTEPIIITAVEFAECFDIENHTSYEQLKKASHNLFQRYITRIRKSSRGDKIEKIRWIDRIAYKDGDGYVELNFTNHVLPYLTALEERFTTYKLKSASALRSVNSWRLFENLKRWESTGKWIVNIEEFHKVMESKKSYKENFAQLRKWVIEPAVKELKETIDLDITWTPVKIGRKVGQIIFTFKLTE